MGEKIYRITADSLRVRALVRAVEDRLTSLSPASGQEELLCEAVSLFLVLSDEADRLCADAEGLQEAVATRVW